MNETTKSGSGYVGYGYKDVTVNQEAEALYSDSYPHFGWELETVSTPFAGIGTVSSATEEYATRWN